MLQTYYLINFGEFDFGQFNFGQFRRPSDRFDSDSDLKNAFNRKPCKAKSSALSGRIILRVEETCFMFLINLSYRFVEIDKGVWEGQSRPSMRVLGIVLETIKSSGIGKTR